MNVDLNSGRAAVVTGYHGTSADRGALILSMGRFLVSENDWDWLGHGVYFWEGEVRVHEWATQRFGKEAAVIQAKINLGLCLDLCDSGI